MFEYWRSERVHQLLIEVAHADLWKNHKAVRYGWCWSVFGIIGKEPVQSDYDRLIDRCYFCVSDECDICLIQWGFLTDDPYKLKKKPILHFGTPRGGINTGAFYDPHYNVISIDGSRPFNKNIERTIEKLISHENLHSVLLKLFPRNDTCERFDNIAREDDKLETCGVYRSRITQRSS